MTSSDTNRNHEGQAPSDDDAVIGRALRWSLVVFAFVGFVSAALVFWWSRPGPQLPEQQSELQLPRVRAVEEAEIPSVFFTQITEQAGITFVHENGAYGDKLLPETMGGGCAFLDYDNDGDQDLFLLNSRRWPWDPRPPRDERATSAMFANDASGNFQDVTDEVGLAVSVYGMGVAVGDYDRDGYVDLFISSVGENRLMRNDAGRFIDVTETAGVAGSADQWSTSSAFVDIDNDGDLDLLVCNYIKWSKEIDLQQDFRLTGFGRAYGPPTSFQGTYPYLYRNEGDGTFSEISAVSGLRETNLATGVPLAKSLGIAPVDFDRDSWIDLVVANDTVRNLVFHNQGDGTFREVGIELGVAFDASGKARGAMGIDAARFRPDGTLGIAIANFANEMTALYTSSGTDSLFTDDAIPTGLGPPTRQELSFGIFFFDYDLDGRLDLLMANGHLEDEIHKVQESQKYRQSARLFWNAGTNGSSEFVTVSSEKCGIDFHEPIVGRGAAYADIDGDGDLDVLLTQVGGPPLLLRNNQQLGHHYVRLKLVGTSSNLDAIGAWVSVQTRRLRLERHVMPARSYLSQVELPLTIGLGGRDTVDKIVVRWPNGVEQQVTDFKIDELTVVVQGKK
jgi:hypothetical protein